MAPDYVLRYLVTHEAVHLAVPDHSQRFWLTVQSLCPETERARQWLCKSGKDLFHTFDTNRSDGSVSSMMVRLREAS
jgi:predicted metal-dependent hydrolase